MYARTHIYGLIIFGAGLFAGCSQEDVTLKDTPEPEEPIAISFAAEGDYETRESYNSKRASYLGAMNSEDLCTTGFGVFASLADNKPDMMYNQEVKFTFVGDMLDPLKGYWSYEPLKYWPNNIGNLTDFFISAYAPYQELPIPTPAPEDPELTGIIGISTNNTDPYVEFRRNAKPEECVDLLWYFEKPTAIPAATAEHVAGTLDMKMRHALARLEVNVSLATAQPEGTKVLIDSISLTGRMAKTGKLHLYEQTTDTISKSPLEVKYYPVWSNQVFDKDGGGDNVDHTIVIDNDDNNALSYGIIDAQVRYIDGLPYAWQPAGLTTEPQNALSTGDRKTYVYLIPQDSPLILTVKVRYHKMTSSTNVMGIKTTTAATTTVTNPLRGNTTYSLNLILRDI